MNVLHICFDHASVIGQSMVQLCVHFLNCTILLYTCAFLPQLTALQLTCFSSAFFIWFTLKERALTTKGPVLHSPVCTIVYPDLCIEINELDSPGPNHFETFRLHLPSIWIRSTFCLSLVQIVVCDMTAPIMRMAYRKVLTHWPVIIIHNIERQHTNQILEPWCHLKWSIWHLNRKHNPVCLDAFTSCFIKIFHFVALVGSPWSEPLFEVERWVHTFWG